MAGADLDTAGVSDNELSLFIDTKLEGQYTYYIDPAFKRNERGLTNIRIKRVEDHPQFSPDWLKHASGEQPGDGQIVEEIETIEVVRKGEPPPPPPPANPGNTA